MTFRVTVIAFDVYGFKLQITVVVDVGPFGSVSCVPHVPSMARLSYCSVLN